MKWQELCPFNVHLRFKTYLLGPFQGWENFAYFLIFQESQMLGGHIVGLGSRQILDNLNLQGLWLDPHAKVSVSAAMFRSNDKNFVNVMSIFVSKPDCLAHFRVEHFLAIFDFNQVAIFPYYAEFCIQSGDISNHCSHSWRIWWPLWSHLSQGGAS